MYHRELLGNNKWSVGPVWVVMEHNQEFSRYHGVYQSMSPVLDADHIHRPYDVIGNSTIKLLGINNMGMDTQMKSL